ncbi:CHAT domain-containing protein [Oxynema sp. CENA135]|uniref:CHAT domain-containing protein n=1 Tax=Oxynema sp. CENA135 TaxID=984206 RepID=UPI00190DF908|nr:CHAT domain-containing protein [Oxynema sp. CENA135]MBK4732403.1 CHAT domain-containing protein [Oxynema sp. CENA135]
MNLSQCRLVTLSACDTAIVDISSPSDDYISFQGAFLSAGANSVVGSLWSPYDMSTAFLMIKFYANLFQGLTVSMALSQAQLWLREVTAEELQDWINEYSNNLIDIELLENLLDFYHPTEKLFSNPFYWAAFTVTGV